MADEIITGSGLAIAVGVKLLNDVCGPTAKYVGGEIRSYTEIGVENLKRVFRNAAKHIQAQNKAEGQVPPRILKEVLSEGYFCEDEVQAMYLGGVLASSKCPVSRDDRGMSYCSLISSLSTYQLRTHFILYSALLRTKFFLIGGQRHPFNERAFAMIGKYGLTVLIREKDYQSAMQFSQHEQPSNIAIHSFVGLETKGLSVGGIQVCCPYNPKDGEVPFRYFYPTILGVELFLWGQGMGDIGFKNFRPDLMQRLDLPFVVDSFEVHPHHLGFPEGQGTR
jgi:hypothetical protein